MYCLVRISNVQDPCGHLGLLFCSKTRNYKAVSHVDIELIPAQSAFGVTFQASHQTIFLSVLLLLYIPARHPSIDQLTFPPDHIDSCSIDWSKGCSAIVEIGTVNGLLLKGCAIL